MRFSYENDFHLTIILIYCELTKFTIYAEKLFVFLLCHSETVNGHLNKKYSIFNKNSMDLIPNKQYKCRLPNTVITL